MQMRTYAGLEHSDDFHMNQDCSLKGPKKWSIFLTEFNINLISFHWLLCGSQFKATINVKIFQLGKKSVCRPRYVYETVLFKTGRKCAYRMFLPPPPPCDFFAAVIQNKAAKLDFFSSSTTRIHWIHVSDTAVKQVFVESTLQHKRWTKWRLVLYYCTTLCSCTAKHTRKCKGN